VAEISSTSLTLDTAHHTWTVLSGHVEAFIQAWDHNAEPPSPVDFLPAGPPPVRRMTLVELIKVDLEYRWIHRRTPRTIEDYIAAHAELAQPDCPLILIPHQVLQLRALFYLALDMAGIQQMQPLGGRGAIVALRFQAGVARRTAEHFQE